MKKKKTGPKPDNIKIEGDWELAMGKAIKSAIEGPKIRVRPTQPID